MLRGYVVALDEFQYFNRQALYEFNSHLQYQIDLNHLDLTAILEILREHADTAPERLLMLWNLFEGVPKFYRDCYEQGVLAGDRRPLLERMFFLSSSPLRTEADNWFLRELRGRYDTLLKFVATHPGCSNADLVAHLQQLGAGAPVGSTSGTTSCGHGWPPWRCRRRRSTSGPWPAWSRRPIAGCARPKATVSSARFGTCKRNQTRLVKDLAPSIGQDMRQELERRGYRAEDLNDLTAGL